MRAIYLVVPARIVVEKIIFCVKVPIKHFVSVEMNIR